MGFISEIREKVTKESAKKVLFPEGEDKRIIAAADFLKMNKLLEPILLGDKSVIQNSAKEVNADISVIEIIDPTQEINTDFIEEYYQLRKHKGMDKKTAAKTLRNPLFYGAMMIRKGIAAGSVAGSINTTGDVLRAGIQIIGLAEGISSVSSCFFMVLKNGNVLTFADCAVIPVPSEEQLASIAVSTAKTHLKVVGSSPNIAMLSFSTNGSAEHEAVTKVIEATAIAKQINPALNIDGELQFDAAYVPEIAKRKAPNSAVAGKANVFIFPDLDSGNIGYKIAQRLADAEAIGPIIQGLARPFNDLSRGCSVEDVINTACICSLMA